jgi:hypothetical protein
MRPNLILIPVCLAAACAPPDYSVTWPDRFIISAGRQPGYAIKRVVEKLGSATLLGDDGSICRTSSHRFAATNLGSWIDCTWDLPMMDDAGGYPTPPLRAGAPTAAQKNAVLQWDLLPAAPQPTKKEL